MTQKRTEVEEVLAALAAVEQMLVTQRQLQEEQFLAWWWLRILTWLKVGTLKFCNKPD